MALKPDLLPTVTLVNDLVVINTGDIDVLMEHHIDHIQNQRMQIYEANTEKQLVINLFPNIRSVNSSITPHRFEGMQDITIAIAWVQPRQILRAMAKLYNEALQRDFTSKICETEKEARLWLDKQRLFYTDKNGLR